MGQKIVNDLGECSVGKYVGGNEDNNYYYSSAYQEPEGSYS